MELWSDPSSPYYSPKLVSRLLNTFGSIRNVFDYSRYQENRNSAEAKRNITHFIGFYREYLWAATSNETKTEWPDTQSANRPNAGWLYLDENNKALEV